MKNRIFLLLSLLLVFPLAARAFLSFCFPISATLLLYLLNWPLIVAGLFVDITFFGPNDFLTPSIIGLIANALILYGIGFILDKRRRVAVLGWRQYKYLLPLVLLIISMVLYGFAYIDPTCWGAE